MLYAAILYLAVTVISISSHEIDTVAVFIPEGPLIGQGAVGDSNVVVVVISGKWTTMVVGHRVTYKDTQQRESGLNEQFSVCYEQMNRMCNVYVVGVYCRYKLCTNWSLHLQNRVFY